MSRKICNKRKLTQTQGKNLLDDSSDDMFVDVGGESDDPSYVPAKADLNISGTSCDKNLDTHFSSDDSHTNESKKRQQKCGKNAGIRASTSCASFHGNFSGK